jgi:NAD(P)-dependent dehydrogenase (short-subunit alcohol dehydrogenase family)
MSDKVISGLARARGLSEEEVDQETTSRVLFGARGEPTDVASLILFLASDDSAYITGSEFKVDGGWLLVNAR